MLLGADGARTYVGPVHASRGCAEDALAGLRLGPGATGHVVHALKQDLPLTETAVSLTIDALRARRRSE
jgi:hypothetical protein